MLYISNITWNKIEDRVINISPYEFKRFLYG